MNKKKILLIDDDVALTQTMQINLQETGNYEVETENNPNRALATARAFQPDLILLDIVMPGMDGGDVLAKLKENIALRNVPVVMLTALVSNEETRGGPIYREGTDQVMLAKPVRLESLIETIQAFLVDQE